MHEKSRERVAKVCRELASSGLCGDGSGTVSFFDRRFGVILVNSAGSISSETTVDSVLAVVDGSVLEGEGEIPNELDSHIEVYDEVSLISSILTADPPDAVAFAQAGRPIKPYGTAHAESFGDLIPCTRRLMPGEIAGELYKNLGRLIVGTLSDPKLAKEVRAVLTCSDKVYALGVDPVDALCRMKAVERTAQSAFLTEFLMRGGASGGTRMQEDLLRKVYENNNL